MAKQSYPIIGNCNFESRDDARGKAIDAACCAAEAGLVADSALLAALDALEETLSECAEKDDAGSAQECRAAERDVERAWTPDIRQAAETARESRYAH